MYYERTHPGRIVLGSIQKVVKSGGHCYNSTGTTTCDLWEHQSICSTGTSRCKLFGGWSGVEKNASESLVICNKIYGEDYEGKV